MPMTFPDAVARVVQNYRDGLPSVLYQSAGQQPFAERLATALYVAEAAGDVLRVAMFVEIGGTTNGPPTFTINSEG